MFVLALLLALVSFAESQVHSPPEGWVWPVSGPHVISRDFDAPHTPWGAGHRGIDIAVTDHPLLFAPVTGRIFFVGEVVDRGVVTIETSAGVLVSMEPVTVSLPQGSMVTAGAVLGSVEPGHCATPCVHVGVRVGGHYVSPARFFGYERRAVLTPWHD